MIPPTLVVLAAGMGSRYGGLKQLDRYGPHGETITDYSIYDALRAGFAKVVFVIRRDFEQRFREAVGNRFAELIEVAYAYQELDALPAGCILPHARTKPWGTGHAILVAREVVQEPFAVINADDFYGRQSYTAIAHHLMTMGDDPSTESNVAEGCMVGYRMANTLSAHGSVSRGVCRISDTQRLEGVVETHGIHRKDDQVVGLDPAHPEHEQVFAGEQIVSMNMWGFTPSLFDHLERLFRNFFATHGSEPKSEFYIPYAVNDLIQTGLARVTVLTTDAQWFGVTFRDDKSRVEKELDHLVQLGVYPSPLWGKENGGA